MKKQNIVYIYKYFMQPKRVSGVSSYLVELVAHLSKKINLIFISYKHSPKSSKEQILENYKLKRVGSPFIIKSALLSRRLNPKKIIFVTAIDNYFLALPFFLIMRVLTLGTPLILHQAVPIKKGNSFLIKINTVFFKKVICTSDYIKKQFAGSKRVLYIPPGVSIKKFSKIKKKGTIKIGFFGHITPNKGVDILLDVFLKARLKNVELFIAGTGPQYLETSELKERLIEKVRNIKNVQIKGYLDDVDKYINSCDFIVLPYRNPYRILGISQTGIEAMVMGKPLIISDVPSLTPLVKHGFNGFIFKNKYELEKYIKKLSKDRKLIEQMGKNAKKYAEEKFDIKKTVDKIIKEVLNERNRKIL